MEGQSPQHPDGAIVPDDQDGRRRLRSVDGPCPFGFCPGTGRCSVDSQGNVVPVDEDGELDWYPKYSIDEVFDSRECPCAEQRNRMRRARRAAHHMPVKLRGARFERWPLNLMADDPEVQLVRKWAERAGTHIADGTGGLWLTGEPGNAKTTLAAAAILLASDRGHICEFWSVSRLLKDIRTTVFGEYATHTESQWVDALAALDVLVLDDLGKEKLSEWVEQTLYDILNAREDDNCRPVILTTNVSEEQLEENVGKPIVSRLNALAGAPILISGPDHRKLQAAEELERRRGELPSRGEEAA